MAFGKIGKALKAIDKFAEKHKIPVQPSRWVRRRRK